MKQHLHAHAARNAKYISPQIQNELIDIVAFDVFQKDLIEEIKQAKFFSILADEVESHHVEQLPLCIRFLDQGNNIREESVEFGKCEHVNGEAIANEIVRLLEKANLDVKNCRGQGYDGASSMSSEAVGVQARIKHAVVTTILVLWSLLHVNFPSFEMVQTRLKKFLECLSRGRKR